MPMRILPVSIKLKSRVWWNLYVAKTSRLPLSCSVMNQFCFVEVKVDLHDFNIKLQKLLMYRIPKKIPFSVEKPFKSKF